MLPRLQVRRHAASPASGDGSGEQEPGVSLMQKPDTVPASDYSAPNVEQALAAFSLLREYFKGALIVDKEVGHTSGHWV